MASIDQPEPAGPVAASVLTLGVPPWMRTAPPPESSDAMRHGLTRGTAFGSAGALDGGSLPGSSGVVLSSETIRDTDGPHWPLRVLPPAASVSVSGHSAMSAGAPTLPNTFGMPGASVIPTKEEKESKEKARIISRELIEKKARADAKQDENLERLSRYLLYLGLCFLPLVHFVEVCYFARELRDANANFFVRRNACLAAIFGVLQVLLGLAWIIAFQVMSDRLQAVNILNANVKYDRLVS